MTVTRGRPVEITHDMGAITLRFDREYIKKLRALATECGIKSLNNYCTFMLISHVNMIEQAKRDAAETTP